MPANYENQQEVANLYQQQTELINAKSTLEATLKKLCSGSNDALIQKIYKASGDSSTTIIWYMQQVILYLQTIIQDNQAIIDAMTGKWWK